MNILFVANHGKTIFFLYLARKLEEQGFSVYWLTSGNYWRTFLEKEGVLGSKILDISRFRLEWAKTRSLSSREIGRLSELEAHNGWSINDMILMDRLLRRKSTDYALRYLTVCAKHIEEFQVKNNIKVVFQEASWAFELITIQICNKLGIKVLCPSTIRHPTKRFAFFEGHTHVSIFKITDPSQDCYVTAEKMYDKFIEQNEHPSYFAPDKHKPKLRLKLVSSLIRHLFNYRKHKGDSMYFPVRYMIKESIRKKINAILYSLYFRKSTAKEYPEKPYIYFTLHVQPESSIDVLASYYNNQLELIRQLARSMPVTHELIVKPHPCAWGAKPISFLKKCNNLPGVKVVYPFMDTFHLTKNAQLVISASGTSSYEAALLGVKALSLATMFFSELLSKKTFIPSADGLRTIEEILNATADKSESRQKAIKLWAQLLANSFCGIIGDPITTPECIAEDNLAKVVSAMVQVIEKVARNYG